MEELMLGVELMAYGLIGVFTVLILFYLMVVIIIKLFPYKEEKQ